MSNQSADGALSRVSGAAGPETRDSGDQRSPGQKFLAARADLLKALQTEWRDQRRSAEIPLLLERYKHCFAEAIVEPLVRKAASLPDPMDSVLLLAAAELVQQWHLSGPIVVGCGKQGSRASPIWEQIMRFDEFKDRLALIDRILAIRKELTRGK